MGKKGETVHFGRVRSSGMYLSRYGDSIASPVVQDGKCILLKGKITACQNYWSDIHWTYDVPTSVKNMHRKFWGFGPMRKDYADFYMRSKMEEAKPKIKKGGKIR